MLSNCPASEDGPENILRYSRSWKVVYQSINVSLDTYNHISIFFVSLPAKPESYAKEGTNRASSPRASITRQESVNCDLEDVTVLSSNLDA